VRVSLRGERVIRRFFGRAMVMVAGKRASPRTSAPLDDDERCRVLVQAVSAGDSFVRRKEARQGTSHRRQRPSLHRPVPRRSHSIVFVAVPARVSVAGRARTKAAVLLLARVFDDRNEGAPSGQCLCGQCRLPLRGVSTTTNGASTSPSRSKKQRRWIEGFRRSRAAGLSSWIGEGSARRSNGSAVVRVTLR